MFLSWRIKLLSEKGRCPRLPLLPGLARPHPQLEFEDPQAQPRSDLSKEEISTSWRFDSAAESIVLVWVIGAA